MEPIVNRKAYFDYEVVDTYEAGIVLLGHEVKAVRAGKVGIVGSYAKVYADEVWLVNATISPYQEKNTPADYDQKRARKLLLKQEEIKELIGKTKEKGYTLVPLKLYANRGRIKVELALCKSKKKYDKREVIKERETKRTLKRFIK
ncbi:SsrA-binding protein [Candidatus Wolfebacteria bacterium RIFCSPHIGHO2_01_FULL_48_22]|uniref:SsrA-binding protein n=2 Tax=Candidatus Wolfeibacteriota TaxID=1752735 RepID=A0A1F8DVB2_9BACT|nr:MAG: SsrA-binding protein [Candidatus Wolfebacteria bacterium RIFCSPHIGHO2_01_FULL_48_22]OGM93919.1 MAG: SsrA-binding protein [Candidatus Wolfebacteria bacterium RIFCSPLOWO2_01_FULL_47_17b]